MKAGNLASSRMDKLYANRRERLLQLIEDRFEWNQSKCAMALDVSSSTICAFVNGRQPIGERAAASIELAARLQPGWLDTNDPARPPIKRVFKRGPTKRGKSR